MPRHTWRLVLILALLLVLIPVPAVRAAAGDTIVVYGGDLTTAERQELAQRFAQGPTTKVDTVTAAEVIAAEQGTGLPAAATDKAISSAALTCRDKGQGLRVRTSNITRIAAATYANALVTAGVGDGDVLIAAPTGNPVTGESGLVGALKAFPQCQGAGQPDPARVRLAYAQVAATVALAGPTGDLVAASNVVLVAAQAVITGKARDAATVGAALDAAAASAGLALDPAARTQAIANLQGLAGADYGTYAQGYQIQQVSPTEVVVTPSGPGAPTAGATRTATAGTPGAPGGPSTGAATRTGATGTAVSAALTGTVTRTGTPLGVRTADGQERAVALAAGATVLRNGAAATLADIQPGDRVAIVTDPAGNATRIEATSAATGGAGTAAVGTSTGAAPGARTTASAAAGGSFSGDVTGAGAVLAVRDTTGQARTVGAATGVVVVRDGRAATFADIRAGDRVNVTTGADGSATRIEASSTSTSVGTTGTTAVGAVFTGQATQAGAVGQPLSARIDGQDRTFAPAPEVAVTRDGQVATLGDIRAGDTVAVTTNADGTATRIAATSAPGAGLGFLRWLLPLLLLLALLLLLLLFLARRRKRDDFILERKR